MLPRASLRAAFSGPSALFGGKNAHFWTSDGTFFGANARVKDSDMSTAKVFEEKENAATSHCFSDLSETRSLRSLGSFEELSSNLARPKKGTPNVKKKIAGVPPAPSVQCGVVRSLFFALPSEFIFLNICVHVNLHGQAP